MSTTKGVKVKYKGSTIHNMPGDGEFKLLTKESYLEDDLDIQVDRDADLDSKMITANGSYNASSDDLDGYNQVTVNVPNSYTEADEGKVVDDGALVVQTSTTKTANGTYDTTLNDEVVINVPNTYTQSDEGKVVSSGALVAQTSKNINANGTVDTTTNNSVVVSVPNSYSAGDEGKVVSNGALVSQGSQTITQNGTYDTTLVSSLTANVDGESIKSDNEPYIFRKSGGSLDFGARDREKDTLIGMDLVWNQYLNDTDFSAGHYPVNTSAVSYDSTNDKTSLSVTMGSDGYGYAMKYMSNIPKIQNHVWLIGAYVSAVNCNYVWAKADANSNTPPSEQYSGAKFYWFIQKLNASTPNAQTLLGVSAPNGTSVTAEFSKAVLINLTTMFGSTIADYVASLGSTNGVAWVQRYLTKKYYPFSNPTLTNGIASSHDMVGFNQWDEVWENGVIDLSTGANQSNSNRVRSKNYVQIIPNTVYYMRSTTSMYAVYYNENHEFVSSTNSFWNVTFTPPVNAHYLRFFTGSNNYGATYKNDICINFSGTRNGQYEAYSKHTYALDTTVDLHGLPMIDTDGNLYADGDTYEADGTVTRNYVKRAYQSGDESLANAITDGTNTVVKLTTPTTETATPFEPSQIVDKWGTEEYVTTGNVPIGHKTDYTSVKLTTKSITANGTYNASADDADGYSKVIVNVSGGGGATVLSRAEWNALSYTQKKAYGLICIQDNQSGFMRGDYVDASEYFEIMQSATGGSSATITANASGQYKLLAIAMNSEASTKTLTISATLNGTDLSGSTLEYNSYSSSGTNRRNYRINLYDIEVSANDAISVSLADAGSHSSLVCAIVDVDFDTVDKALTSADGKTTGSNSSNGYVLYGTFDNNNGGTITGENYLANETIETASPGTNYKSSYMFWVSKS